MKRHLGASTPELRYEPTITRVRAFLDGRPAVDSRRAVLVWEPRRLVPVYAVPVADLRVDHEPADPQPDTPDLDGLPPMLGPLDFWIHTTPGTVVDLTTTGRRLDAAGFLPDDPDLADHVVLEFGAFDEWRVEDDELVAHPHDPFKRIDILHTSRQVEVSLDGVVLAATSRAQMLLETHLPPRYYVPPEDVRTDLLVPSDTTTSCAYKGHASYFSTADGKATGRDIGWHYLDPLDDALRVRDHVCFWSERTDLVVDGEPMTRPITPWSPPEEQARAATDLLEFG